VELLQTEADVLRAALPRNRVTSDQDKLVQLLQLGFKEDNSRVALENASNNIERAIESLLRAFQSEEELKETLERVGRMAGIEGQNWDGPSTSSASIGAQTAPRQIEKSFIWNGILWSLD